MSMKHIPYRSSAPSIGEMHELRLALAQNMRVRLGNASARMGFAPLRAIISELKGDCHRVSADPEGHPHMPSSCRKMGPIRLEIHDVSLTCDQGKVGFGTLKLDN